MWFRQGQSVDADGFRVSLKNRMRRFRSPEKNATINSTASLDHGDPSATQSVDARLTRSTDDAALDQLNQIKSTTATTLPPASSQKKQYKNDKDKTSTAPAAAATLLTDRKFKNNRIVKSSSKGKLVDSGETANGKSRSANARKISSPPVLETGGTQKISGAALAAAAVKKHVRSHSNLNLNVLLRYKLTNKKQLSSADFDRIRRKSLSGEAVLLSALEEPPTTLTPLVTEPKVNAADEQTTSQDDVIPVDVVVVIDDANEAKNVCGDNNDELNVDDNGGGCEDDDEDVFHKPAASTIVLVEDVKTNKKSPSLGARVAARFSESATARAKKAKQKKRKNSRGSTLYQQNSFGKILIIIIKNML